MFVSSSGCFFTHTLHFRSVNPSLFLQLYDREVQIFSVNKFNICRWNVGNLHIFHWQQHQSIAMIARKKNPSKLRKKNPLLQIKHFPIYNVTNFSFICACTRRRLFLFENISAQRFNGAQNGTAAIVNIL